MVCDRALPSDMPSRVLIVSATTVIPDTGAKTRLAVTIRALRSLGVERIDLLAFESPSMLFPVAELKTQRAFFDRLGVRVRFVPLWPKRGPGGRSATVRVSAVAIAAFARLQRPDLLVAVNADAGAACEIAENLHSRRWTRLLELHGIESEEAIFAGTVDRGSKEHRRRQAIEEGALRWADVVVAPTDEAIEWGSEVYPNGAQWWTLPTLSPLKLTSEEAATFRSEARQKLGWQDRKVLLYVGGMNPWQQPELMADLYSELLRLDADWRFLVVTPDTVFAQTLFDARGLGTEHVHITSAAPDRVAELGVAGDVGLMLRQEHLMNRVASPTKFGEYLEMGVPVITTDALPSAARVCRSDEVGVVVPADTDPNNCAALIERFVQSGAREDVGVRCRSAAVRHFDESVARELYSAALWGQR